MAIKRFWGRANKYGAKKTELAGRTFDSKGEANCFLFLTELESAGSIRIDQHQYTVPLVSGISYRADFRIFDTRTERTVLVEFKGPETETWRMKKKLYKDFGPFPLWIYKGYGKQIKLHETIIPRGIDGEGKPIYCARCSEILSGEGSHSGAV